MSYRILQVIYSARDPSTNFKHLNRCCIFTGAGAKKKDPFTMINACQAHAWWECFDASRDGTRSPKNSFTGHIVCSSRSWRWCSVTSCSPLSDHKVPANSQKPIWPDAETHTPLTSCHQTHMRVYEWCHSDLLLYIYTWFVHYYIAQGLVCNCSLQESVLRH